MAYNGRLSLYHVACSSYPREMITKIHPIPAFTDNYIWAVLEANTNNVCVVDPGDARPVIDYLESHNLQLSDILITHHHPDHTGGILQLRDKYSCRVTGPGSSNINGLSEQVAEGDLVSLYDRSFQVIEVPGHTLDHIAFYSAQGNGEKAEPILFCGDTLFAAGCGRLFEGTPAMMHNSLQKLASLPADTKVFCTHEYTLANLKFALAVDANNSLLIDRITIEKEKRNANLPTLPSSIELERSTNPFLRCKENALLASASLRLGNPAANEVEVFSALRAWKDSF